MVQETFRADRTPRLPCHEPHFKFAPCLPRLIGALGRWGYYAGAITMGRADGGASHDGRDPDLPEWMQAIAAGHKAQITITALPASSSPSAP